MVSKGTNSLENSRVLNFECCFHVCWNIDWFNTCKTCDEGFVTLASNVECKIVGIDKIKVKMLDGTMKVLGNVRHVLELGRNLILLCRLDALGNGYFARGGIMKDVLWW
jgi:hypothetical protein